MKPTKFLILSALFAMAALITSGFGRAAEAAVVADKNSTDETAAIKGLLNKSEKLEAFRDQAIGMFIHWSVDV